MSLWRTAAVASALTLALAGCSGGTGAATEKTTPSTTIPVTPTAVPHFEGALDVRLVAATPMLKSGTCEPDPARRLVCDATSGKGFILTLDPRPASLVDVTTEPSKAGTEWDTTLRFASGAQLGWAAGEAHDIGGYLLMLEAKNDTVLLSHVVRSLPSPSVRSNRLFPDPSDKATAWAFVQKIEELTGD